MVNEIKEVFIRKLEPMRLKFGKEWNELERAMTTRTGVPIYYQELQPKNPQTAKFEDKDIIGTALKVYEKNDYLVCDIALNPFNPLKEHFIGMIDNWGMSIKTKDGESEFYLERFIVYDRYKKEEVNNYVRKQSESTK